MTNAEAIAQGIAWAEREAEIARDQGLAVEGPWLGTRIGALPLINSQSAIRRDTLARVCNVAAATRWAGLVVEAAEETIAS